MATVNSEDVLETDPEQYLLLVAPKSKFGQQGKELIRGYFNWHPEAIPRLTHAREIAVVSFKKSLLYCFLKYHSVENC